MAEYRRGRVGAVQNCLGFLCVLMILSVPDSWVQSFGPESFATLLEILKGSRRRKRRCRVRS